MRSLAGDSQRTGVRGQPRGHGPAASGVVTRLDSRSRQSLALFDQDTLPEHRRRVISRREYIRRARSQLLPLGTPEREFGKTGKTSGEKRTRKEQAGSG